MTAVAGGVPFVGVLRHEDEDGGAVEGGAVAAPRSENTPFKRVAEGSECATETRSISFGLYRESVMNGWASGAEGWMVT